MFIKRLISQGLVAFGMILGGILALIGIGADTACMIGGGISAVGIIYSCIALKCPFCHSRISLIGFYIDHCPECGEKF